MSPSRHLILGPPGTGKTTHLLSIIDKKLEQGVKPERIAYYSFTRAATKEAIDRACEKFGFKRRQLPHFRTLHSESWHVLSDLGYSPDLLNDNDLRDIGKQWRIYFLRPSFFKEVDNDDRARGMGDVFLHFYRLCRALKLDPVQFRRAVGEDFFKNEPLTNGGGLEGHSNMTWTNFCDFYEIMRERPDKDLKMDYPDLIDMAVKVCPPLQLDVGIVDEAQDLSKQQWDLCWTLLAGCKEIYIAGDDDQAIYQWSGADLHTFRRLGGEPNTDTTVLEKTWRLPRKIFEVAETLSNRIVNRYPKAWHPRDEEGEVHTFLGLRGIPFENGEKWMVLARNDKFLSYPEQHLRKLGFAYEKNARRSVRKEHWDAIRFWTRLTKRKSVPPEVVRLVYAHLLPAVVRDVDSLVRGRELSDAVGDVTIEYLQKNLGLLVNNVAWYEVLDIDTDTSEYYRAVIRKYGVAQLAEPLISLQTIHAVKGAECPNVVVLRSMSKATWDNYQRDPDSEHRVFYVAVTRASKRLYVVRQPSGAKYHYE